MSDAIPGSHRPAVVAAEGFPVLVERDRDEEAQAERRRPRKPTSWLLTVFMLICVGYFLLPLFWLVVASTKSNDDLFSSFGLWFANFNLFENIQTVLTYQDGVFIRWALNSLIYAVVSAVGASFLATAAGYAFAKYRFPGSTALFSITLGAIMIPLAALTVPTYLLFAKAGLTDTYWAIILPSLATPFGVFLMRVYAADAVDDALIEAARVDGVGELRIFFTIALRLLLPGTVTVLLFTLVATWNNYFLPLIMLNSADIFPLPVGLALWQSTARRRIRLAGPVLYSDHRFVVGDNSVGDRLSCSCSATGNLAWLPAASRPDSPRKDIQMVPPRDRVLFGAAYYHEYQPGPRLEDDLDLMAGAGFSVIRVGESVWTTWEPEEGRFDLDWLAPVLDGANRRGIRVVLGTPDLRRSALVGPSLSGDRRRDIDGTANAVGRPARDRLHPSGVQVLRRKGDPQDHLALRRPSGGDRISGRQRARHALVPQPRRLPTLRRRAPARLWNGGGTQ